MTRVRNIENRVGTACATGSAQALLDPRELVAVYCVRVPCSSVESAVVVNDSMEKVATSPVSCVLAELDDSTQTASRPR